MEAIHAPDGRRCRVCGCTDITACVDEDGSPCAWVDDDLCTLCDERLPVIKDKLLAAASSFAAAAGDCADAARDAPGDLNRSNVAGGDTLVIALDALRLLMEASGEAEGALYVALVKELSQ